jgi:aminopeptidase N
LNKYKYANAIQDNLWEELTEAAYANGNLNENITVKDIMDTWTLKKGYPVLHVNRTFNNMSVTQKWFLLNPTSNSTDKEDYKWFVPFTYTSKNEADFNFEKSPTWLKPTDSFRNIFYFFN